MESAPTAAGESRPIVRLPSAAFAVSLFVGLYVLGDLPFYLLEPGGTLGFGLGYPFGLASALAIVALVVAVIVIDRPVAIFIGVAAGTASSMAHHYWTYRDAEYVSNWNLPREPASDVFVDAVLSSGVRLGLIGVAALLAGRYLISRENETAASPQQQTVRLPSVKTCLLLLGILLVIDLVGTQSPNWPIWREVVGRGLNAAGALSFVALFLAVFTVFRPRAMWLVLLVYVQQVTVATLYSGCINNDVEFTSCIDEILRPYGPDTLILMLLFAAVAYPCRAWANRPPVDRHSHSGGDSISSSKLPAGSRT